MNPLNPQHILLNLQSATAFAAIDELLDQLVSTGTLPPEAREPTAAAVKRRERSMSTGIGFGVALPHASTPRVDDVVVAFGRSSGGIDFAAVDQQPVRLVLLVLFPARNREKHLPTLARLSQLLHRAETRAALEAAPDGATVARILDPTP